MSQTTSGIDALTDEDWERMEEMSEEYDDEFGELLGEMVANRDSEVGDE